MKEALGTHRLEPAFVIGERFEIRHQLGRGGMGIVYSAYDRESRKDVALKMLPKREPDAMYRLKQEFRALTDVVHPNLVVLHELIATDDQCFFTMQLIDGVDLVQWVCGANPNALCDAAEQSGATRRDPIPHGARLEAGHTVTLEQGQAPPDPEPREPLTEKSPGAAGQSSFPPAVRARMRADVGRLRAALGQLTAAIATIHEARKLHLDLKPANVMVERGGRVVVLDFGLARDIRPDVERSPADTDARGTPAYMAPEQALGLPLTPAADWYAVGAILFRILTGQLLSARPKVMPPSALVDGVPDDLDALCVALLHPDPTLRAGAADVLRSIPAADAPDPPVPPTTPTPGGRMPFVGREAHLHALMDAFEATRAGHPVVAFLGGRSGMGKTALAMRLTEDLHRWGAALVLSGRCYERESVPFKALDSVIDALADYLKRLPRSTAVGLMPRGIHDLGRLFPALRQVEAITDVPRRSFDISDDGERRRRAFAALKELLSRLVDTRPLVLFIDDLQWGDLDSARLLAEVLGPPDPPALLLIGTYRTEEQQQSAALAELLRLDVRDVRRLEVLGLTAPEARDLALTLLGDASVNAEERARSVATESEGNPFFVLELARHATSPLVTSEATPGLSLEQALRARFERLGPEAARLLEVVAVAGGPVAQGVAARAAAVDSDPLTVIAALRAAHFVRTRGTRDMDEIETYHDRIRETVVRWIAPEVLAHHHLRLALELEATGRADPEVLAAHFLAVGREEEARRYVLAGAEQASAALAFDKAARLYRQAIELGAGGSERRRELSTKLGDALEKSGRGKEAALAFLSAAAEAAPDDAIALRHSAAEQFLISGHVDEGMDVLEGVLRVVDLPLPGTPRRALLSLLAHRTRLRLRGLKFRKRAAEELPRETLRQIDICFSAALGLSVVDWIYGASFQALQLVLALSAGEPKRIALGLAFEAGHVGCAGGPTRGRALELIAAAEALSNELDDPATQGFTRLMKGVAEWGVGRFRTGLEHTTEAERILRERCTGAIWQIDTAQVFSMICMTSLGDLQKLSERHPVWLKEARERGDLYATTSLRTFWGSSTLLALAADEPGRAWLDIDDAMSRWSRRGYHPQHYYALMSRSLVDLYRGDAAAAYDRISRAWPKLKASLLLKVQGLAITAHTLRGCAAVAAAASASDKRTLLRSALYDADLLTRTKVEWSVPLSEIIVAGVAAVEGNADRERSLLASAVRGFEGAHMALHAAAARYALGLVVGGDEGRDDRGVAERYMASQEVTRPASFAAMLCPCIPIHGGPS